MFGIGIFELLIVLLMGGFFLAIVGVLVAAAIKILRSGNPPQETPGRDRT